MSRRCRPAASRRGIHRGSVLALACIAAAASVQSVVGHPGAHAAPEPTNHPPFQLSPTGSGDWATGWCAAGTNGTIYAATVWRDQLLIGGSFTALGQVPASRVAVWDGAEWRALGDGLPSVVNDVAVFDDRVIALTGMAWTGAWHVGDVRTWDGVSWAPLAGAQCEGVTDLVATAEYLYLLGDRVAIEGDEVHIAGANVVRWDGMEWEVLSPPFGSWPGFHPILVEASSVGADLVFTWGFYPDNPDPFDPYGVNSHIMRYAGDRWIDFRDCDWETHDNLGGWGDALVGYAWDVDWPFVYYEFELFPRENRESCQYSRISMRRENTPLCVTEWREQRFVGLISALEGASVLTLTDAQFHDLPGSPNGGVGRLIPTADRLYAFGYFSEAGGQQAWRLAQWDGAKWDAVGEACGNGVVGDVVGVEADATGFTIVGQSPFAGNVHIQGLARWDGGAWTSVEIPSATIGNSRKALLTLGSDLFVTAYVPEIRHGIYRVSGQGVERVGEANSNVTNLTEHRGSLAVGGGFDHIRGIDTGVVATWSQADGWKTLGPGLRGALRIVVSTPRGLLVQGENLSPRDDTAPPGTAFLWDGTRWSAVDPAPDFEILDSVTKDDELFAVGKRWVAENPDTSWIGHYEGALARWAGEEWTPVADSIDAPVHAIAWSHGALYIAGAFTHIDGAQFAHIARLQGDCWTSPGTLDGAVYDLEATADGLVMVGNFWFANGVPSAHIATLRTEPTTASDLHTFILGPPFPNPTRDGFSISFTPDRTESAHLALFDAAGRRVRRLFEGHIEPACRILTWESVDDSGRNLRSGVYFIRASSDAGTESRRLLLLR